MMKMPTKDAADLVRYLSVAHFSYSVVPGNEFTLNRIEELIQAASVSTDTYRPDGPDLKVLWLVYIHEGKISTIRLYRKLSGEKLIACKQAVEDLIIRERWTRNES